MSLGCYGYVGWGFCSCLNGRFTPVRDQGGREERKERKARAERNTHNHSFGGASRKEGYGQGRLTLLARILRRGALLALRLLMELLLYNGAGGGV